MVSIMPPSRWWPQWQTHALCLSLSGQSATVTIYNPVHSDTSDTTLDDSNLYHFLRRNRNATQFRRWYACRGITHTSCAPSTPRKYHRKPSRTYWIMRQFRHSENGEKPIAYKNCSYSLCTVTIVPVFPSQCDITKCRAGKLQSPKFNRTHPWQEDSSICRRLEVRTASNWSTTSRQLKVHNII